MLRLAVRTRKKREVVDLTDSLEEQLEKGDAQTGICHILVLHTTGTDLDMLDAFEEMMPKLRYRHPHDPSHVPDHILSALIGTCLSLPFENRKLVLGTWQRVVLIELDGPRERELAVSVFAEN